LSRGKIGFGPQLNSERTERITWLLDNPEKGRKMAETGRRIVEDLYSLQILSPRLSSYIKSFSK
jgi:hypothetical protein